MISTVRYTVYMTPVLVHESGDPLACIHLIEIKVTNPYYIHTPHIT